MARSKSSARSAPSSAARRRVTSPDRTSCSTAGPIRGRIDAAPMNLTPFACVDGTPFTASPEEIATARGRPARTCRNGIGLHELDYGDVVFRFQDSGRLEEVTTQAPVVHFGAVAVPFASLHPFVRSQDPDAFERAGFVVSPALGLAFAPECPTWVTALARH